MASLGEAIANALGVTDPRARADIIKFGQTVYAAIPADPIQTAFIFSAICASGDLPGDCIYRTGVFVDDVPEVAKVDITNLTKMPAKGVIISKASTTACTVAYFGAYATGDTLVTDKVYFVGADARPTITRPSGPAFIQIVGHALDAARLMVNPSMNFTKVI